MLSRRTPPRAKAPLVRRAPLRQVATGSVEGTSKPTLRASAPVKRSYTPAVPVAVRDALRARSGGWCEIAAPGCAGRAVDPAHRLKRGMGGRKRDAKTIHDRLSNLLYACRRCHQHTHAHPGEAYQRGWMLREGQDPTQTPVWYRGRLAVLDDTGSVCAWPAAGAA